LVNDNNVTVQRYIPNERRAFRILAPSVTTSTSINANWQEGVHNTVFGVNIDPHPGYGIQITGAAGAKGNFDVTATNQPSLFFFNCDCEVPWVAAPNTNMNLDVHTGYLVFVRGDRSTDMTATEQPLPTSATTLRATGTLAKGPQQYSNLNDTGFSLIANPFASAINWRSIYSHNTQEFFENYYTYWDPTLGARGAYATVNIDNVNSAGTNATVDIPSGLAFFVKGRDPSGQSHDLIINESDKSKINNINVFAPAKGGGTLAVKLFYKDEQNTRRQADGAVAIFNDAYSSDIDRYDAQKLSNMDENIGWSVANKHLSIQSLPLLKGNEKLSLFINNLRQTNYELQFEPLSFASNDLILQLIDKYTSQVTRLSITEPVSVPFTVNADAASKAADRFSIQFVKPEIPVEAEKALINIYPNPVSANTINVNVKSLEKGKYSIRLLNSNGQMVYIKQISHLGGSLSANIDIQNITPGIYQLRVGGLSAQFIRQ
jgi:hypothetical protein